MTNLLQENIEMKSPRTNSTFDLCQHAGKPEKAKRAIFLPTLNRNNGRLKVSW